MKDIIQIGKVAFVKVPEDATGYIGINSAQNWMSYFVKDECFFIDIPEGNWTILGRALELTEYWDGKDIYSYLNHKDKTTSTPVVWIDKFITYKQLLIDHQITNNYVLILNKEK